MIHARDIHKSYGATSVLRGVSFEVPAGGLAAVLGKSGAGKSTLLRCLVGLEPFDAGALRVGEIEVAAPTDGPRATRAALASLRGRVGLVFQSFELFANLNVLDNCTLAPRKVRGLSRDAAESAARAILERLGLGEKLLEYPDRLSGGQRQRVAIARALAMEPRVLLYDEPTSALDPQTRREVHAILRNVQGSGVTQVVVTHDVSLAREATDQVFVIHAGQVVESGASAQVLESPSSDVTRALLRGEPG